MLIPTCSGCRTLYNLGKATGTRKIRVRGRSASYWQSITFQKRAHTETESKPFPCAFEIVKHLIISRFRIKTHAHFCSHNA